MQDHEVVAALERYIANHPADVTRKVARAADVASISVTETGSDRFIENALVSPTWVIGGMTGGNCWGSRPNIPVSVDPRPSWLESLLEEVVPELSFAQYRKLDGLRQHVEYQDPEYYGNYYIRAFEVITLNAIRKALSD